MSFLNAVAESQFGALASALGTVGLACATLVALLVLFNMAFQVRPMVVSDSLKLILKLGFISLFFHNWSNFNIVANALFSLLEAAGGALISSVAAESGNNAGFSDYGSMARSFDTLLKLVNNYVNAVGSNLGYVGRAMFSLLFMVLTGTLGALALFVLTASRVVITILLGLGPIVMLCLLFEVSKNWFERWLSAVISFALYPVIISGVFATILGVCMKTIKDLGDPSEFTNIGKSLPLVMMVFLAIALIVLIPFLVSMISGNIAMGSAGTAFAGAAGSLAKATGSAGMRGAKGAGGVATNTARSARDFASNPQQATRQAYQGHADSINRTLERFRK